MAADRAFFGDTTSCCTVLQINRLHRYGLFNLHNSQGRVKPGCQCLVSPLLLNTVIVVSRFLKKDIKMTAFLGLIIYLTVSCCAEKQGTPWNLLSLYNNVVCLECAVRAREYTNHACLFEKHPTSCLQGYCWVRKKMERLKCWLLFPYRLILVNWVKVKAWVTCLNIRTHNHFLKLILLSPTSPRAVNIS